MPKASRAKKRPADVVSNAVHVMRVLTGEAEDVVTTKSPTAQEMGRKGGEARKKALTSAERKAIAKKAAAARWKG